MSCDKNCCCCCDNDDLLDDVPEWIPWTVLGAMLAIVAWTVVSVSGVIH